MDPTGYYFSRAPFGSGEPSIIVVWENVRDEKGRIAALEVDGHYTPDWYTDAALANRSQFAPISREVAEKAAEDLNLRSLDGMIGWIRAFVSAARTENGQRL